MPNPIDPNLLEKIKEMLRRDLKLGAAAVIPDDLPLLGSQLDLDSLDILLLVTNIEKQLKVRIPNESIGKEVFASVATLARFVQDHHPAAPAAGRATESGEQNWLQRLPHGEPFRFVSRLIDVEPGKSAKGVWSLSGSEPFFAGHFPGHPIVPGLLIAEALAQISGLAGPTDAGAAGKLAHVDVRFTQSVSPPAEIELHSEFLHAVATLQTFQVQAQHGGVVVARGTVTLHRSAGAAK